MVKLLLDEHISPDVAEGMRRRLKELTLFCLAEWENGRVLGQPDDRLLREAGARRLTLVTYDRKTIPPLLKIWAETGRDHGGVIFVDDKTIPPSDLGGIIRGLRRIVQESRGWDWNNRICFLRR